MKALAEKGHDVSLIAPFKDKNPPERYREIYLEQLINQAEGRSNCGYMRYSCSDFNREYFFKMIDPLE